jgi:hypothetical protein
MLSRELKLVILSSVLFLAVFAYFIPNIGLLAGMALLFSVFILWWWIDERIRAKQDKRIEALMKDASYYPERPPIRRIDTKRERMGVLLLLTIVILAMVLIMAVWWFVWQPYGTAWGDFLAIIIILAGIIAIIMREKRTAGGK